MRQVGSSLGEFFGFGCIKKASTRQTNIFGSLLNRRLSCFSCLNLLLTYVPFSFIYAIYVIIDPYRLSTPPLLSLYLCIYTDIYPLCAPPETLHTNPSNTKVPTNPCPKPCLKHGFGFICNSVASLSNIFFFIGFLLIWVIFKDSQTAS